MKATAEDGSPETLAEHYESGEAEDFSLVLGATLPNPSQVP